MALNNFKNFLISEINRINPEIDTAVGSGFRDILVDPLSPILYDYSNQQQRVLSKLTITDPNALTEQELDAIGLNFLITRNLGEYQTGRVKLYYQTAQSVTIPEGTLLVNPRGGTNYVTVRAYTITTNTMQSQFDGSLGLFGTADIAVRSTDRTDRGALSPGDLLQWDGGFSPVPDRIVVSEAITGGVLREDNTRFYQRIKNSVKTSTLASETVLEDTIRALSSNILRVKVIGAGNPLMLRDLVSYAELDVNTVEDFYLVQRQNNLKEHEAYSDNFLVEIDNQGPSTAMQYPANPSAWISEFSNEQYRGIYSLGDSYMATQDEYQIISVPT